ncbi:hydrogenase maturation nickel metallochaperone HypA/HybF [Actinoallomurus rhizosphaericola]|uniref:hydrogenase maturation nickel metallochaperone HypA/HybF n=1 Tax=Actinoallomurus rhizosphaericola TaxID=2952536 RepID=UPI0020936AB5|nr:hydrogenase maturation nickel metallochaperone HypA [Actinoallomurus rhizosphaericola]MCO5996037.1 hydrogenase maturation nickel metallochaperone HypA [Actinoallomurus rhizosphaericola]
MHEAGMAEAILAAVEQRADGRPVRRTRVRAGVLLRIGEAALGRAFELAADGTVAEGARLEVVVDPVRLTCGRCDRTTTSDGLMAVCPVCGGTDLAIEGGDELVLESIEVVETAEVPGDSRRDPRGPAGSS